ncbi:hypothetical protein Lser_V15G41706 [Lactuca serriola]
MEIHSKIKRFPKVAKISLLLVYDQKPPHTSTEKYFRNAYRGDTGVPHSSQEKFLSIWNGKRTLVLSLTNVIAQLAWIADKKFN